MHVPDAIDIEVGRRLRSLRLKKGVSQVDLAEAGSITFQQVQKYERGANRLSASMLCRFAAKLRVSPLALLPGDEDDLIEEIAVGSREVAEAVALLSPLSRSEQQRMVQILRLAAAPFDEV
ncbi:MAG: transcriptional regulator [Phenylobacterium sp.]|uniref:helix-turn-helix domain-containing protein n=1 Tax=Phenylobacterium sp. TaxID=1871053 RepID=UPI0025D33736|nr:helix-turn-helix transcriptional regulator [Phenylobacterium sp.]MBA4010703.1 transcriptional regulator [Phenylobacterium sp.]